jgi:hypothetical protein
VLKKEGKDAMERKQRNYSDRKVNIGAAAKRFSSWYAYLKYWGM